MNEYGGWPYFCMVPHFLLSVAVFNQLFEMYFLLVSKFLMFKIYNMVDSQALPLTAWFLADFTDFHRPKIAIVLIGT